MTTDFPDMTLRYVLPREFIPLDKIVPGESLDALLDRIIVTSYGETFFKDIQTGVIEYDLSVEPEIVCALPGLEGLALVLGGASNRIVTLNFRREPDTLKTTLAGAMRLRFPREWLRPVVRQDGKWVDDPARSFVELDLSAGVLIEDGSVRMSAPEFTLQPAMIASTGFVLEGKVVIDASEKDALPETIALGLGTSWRGVIFKTLTLHLPDSLNVQFAPSDLQLTNFHIGSGGISGSVSANWTPTLNGSQVSGSGSGTMSGFPLALRKLELSFLQNALMGIDIRGVMVLPFFDTPLDVELGLDLDGNWQVITSTATGLANIRKDGVLDLQLQSLGFGVEDGQLRVLLSGTLTPLFVGVEWPGFEVKELAVDAKGNVKLDGGWLNLRDQYSLELYGFHMELTKIGFGRTNDGGRWVGFSGAVQLVDGLPAGASVEGLRLTWWDGSARKPSLSFEGIGVQFSVPGVLSFDGAVAFKQIEHPGGVKENRFDGKIKVVFEVLDGLAIDGQLVVGKKGDTKYFAIYLDAQLPAGIPLASTGLGLYGMAGLFAYQMLPSRLTDPAKQKLTWYEWYKGSQGGVSNLANWGPKAKSLAFGAGMTLGTVADNGYAFATKVLFVILFPGPIILFDGRANLMRERSELQKSDDTNFKAFGVLDFIENSLQFNLDARYKIDPATGALMDLQGGAEVFFDWDDYNWHLYVGQQPPEKRIRAKMFAGLLPADAYFMLDNRQLRMGASIGFDPSWQFGPLRLDLWARIEGNARLSWKPNHLHGNLGLHGRAGLTVYRWSKGIDLSATLSADAFRPFHVVGNLEAGMRLPWPIKRNVGVNVRVEWGPKRSSPPLRLPLPLKEVAVEHLAVTTKWPLPRGQFLLPNYGDGDDGSMQPTFGFTGNPVPANLSDIPVVPVDGRPHLTFSRPMHDDALVGINTNASYPAEEVIGDPTNNRGVARVRYGLKEVALEKYDATTKTWTAIAGAPNTSGDLAGKPRLYGSWAPVPPLATAAHPTWQADRSVGQVKLWLWSKTPYNYTLATGSRWDAWFDDAHDHYPCPPKVLGYDSACNFETLRDYQWVESPFACPTHQVQMSWTNASAICRPTNPGHSHPRYLALTPQAGQVGELTIVGPRIDNIDNLTASLHQVKGAPGDYTFRAYNAQGQEIWSQTPTTTPSSATPQSAQDVVRLRISFKQPFGIFLIGVYVHVTPDTQQLLDLERHITTQLAQWGQADDVLEPHTTYRLRVKTQLDVRGEGPLAGYSATPQPTEYAYFRTEGPPGVTTLERPEGYSAAETFKSGLEDLTPYVEATTPRSQGSDGKPVLTRPVYRAYDVGVDFNVNYVDQMYRMARRDLQLYLYDNSNRPVRDAQGRLVVMPTSWGQADAVTLTKAEERWTQALTSSGCIMPPTNFSSQRVRQGLKHSAATVLDPDRLYEARLVPLLLREEFSDVPAGSVATTLSSTLGPWSVIDKGTSSGPGRWVTGSEGTPAAGFITQTSGITGGGTLLTYTGDGTLPPEGQPAAWTSYRLSAHARLVMAGGESGLVVRYQDKNNYYVFAITDKARRLFRREPNSVTTVLASQALATPLALGKDYLLSVEVEGGRIRAYQDGVLIFDVQDATLPRGGVGLYCASQPGARFTGVRVDDMREQAPVLFRFPFTTSRFVNFSHHLHSYGGRRWEATLSAETPLNAALNSAVAAQAGAVSLEEAQAYRAFAEAVLGVARERQSAQELEVTHVSAGGALRALLVRSPEPIDWTRTDLAFTRTATALPRPTAPRQVKLVGATFAGGGQPSLESVQLLLTERVSLAGWRVEYRALAATTTNATPWQTYYTFGAEELRADGTRLRVSSGSSSTPPAALPGVLERYVAASGAGTAVFPAAGVELRLVAPDGTVAHQHAFLPDSAYASVDVKIVRKADGTGFALLAAPFETGSYRLALTFRRGEGAPKLSEAGNTGHEHVTLDII